MKITPTAFKKLVGSLDENELRAELLKLFEKLDQVQAFYAQELTPKEDRAALLEKYKKQIHSQFWTKSGQPRVFSNAELKRILTDFEKVSVFPHELVDVILYRVEMLTKFASNYGGVMDSDYNPAITAFKKAVKLIKANKLEKHFQIRIQELFRADNLDMWYIDFLEQVYHEQ
jgi:hypothetical protein